MEGLNYFHSLRDVTRARVAPELDRLDEEFRNRYSARLSLASAVSWMSPSFCLRSTVLGLAGTGIERHSRFERAYLDGYRRDQYRPWVDRVSSRLNLARVLPAKYGDPRWNLNGFPRFAYAEMSSGEAIYASILGIATLCVFALAFLAAAFVAMLKYDVR